MSNNKPNSAFWIISIIALLWNAFGVFQYLGTNIFKEAVMESMTEAEVALVEGLPSWYNYVFAVAVIAGFLGCLMLVLRKKLASPLLGISLLAVLIQMGYWMFATDVMEVVGIQAVVMPMLVIVVSIFLYFYSKGAAQKGWLK